MAAKNMTRFLVAIGCMLMIVLIAAATTSYFRAVASAQMHEAVMRSDLNEVKHLLAAGRDINELNRGEALGVRIRSYPLQYENDVTPLYVAVAQTEVPLVAHLLDNGADPNFGGGYDTPLHLALICMQPSINIHGYDLSDEPPFDPVAGLEVIRLLLAHGADPNLRRFDHSETAIEMSERLGQDDSRRLMLYSTSTAAGNAP
jgi:hypothetical protein